MNTIQKFRKREELCMLLIDYNLGLKVTAPIRDILNNFILL